MKLQKLLCLGFSGSELEDIYWQELDALAEKRVIGELADNTDADGLLVKLGAKVLEETIDQLPSLKYIGMLGTGYGGIDAAYAASKGITVTNIADYATEGVAEFTFGILLEHIRAIAHAKGQAKNEDYSDNFSGTEIKGKKFGVIGLGNIGLRTAELAQAFGADVNYWSKNRKDDAEAKGIKYSEIDELLSGSDIITINLALNPETDGFLNPQRIESIKKGAIVINPSPMELLELQALKKSLNHDQFTFMLDHSDEVEADEIRQLAGLKQCIVYPPIAYLTAEASALKKRIYVDNVKNFLAGKPSNKVN